MIGSKNGQKIANQKPAPGLSKPTNTSLKTTTPVTKPGSHSSLGTKGIQPVKKVGGSIVEEEKKETPKTGLFTTKPSTRFTSIKTSDPFAAKTNLKNNSFAYVYNAGGIPCRIDHGTAFNRIKWDSNVSLEDLHFDPLLITCFEGLMETAHPYNFIAKQAIKELLESPGAAEKTVQLLPRIITPLRLALSSPNATVFENALGSLKSLSDTVGDALNEHLNGLIGALLKRMNDKKYKETILNTLRDIEANGGPSVVKIIKAKIPTYSNM